jgi:hypothetical protein
MGEIKYYKHISVLIFCALLFNGVCILFLNSRWCDKVLTNLFSEQKAFIIQLFFWSTLGGTVACSLFLAQDKERNEMEACKKSPRPEVLQYPDLIDVHLYAQRIATSGFLGLIGSFLLFAGLGYFDVPINNLNLKHKVFLVLTAFVVGLYQKHFLESLASFCKKMFERSNGKSAADRKPDSDQV